MKNKNNDFFKSHGILFNDDLSNMSNVSIKVIGEDGIVLKEASSKEKSNDISVLFGKTFDEYSKEELWEIISDVMRRDDTKEPDQDTLESISGVLGGVSEALSSKTRIDRELRLIETDYNNLVKKHKIVFYITIFVLLVNFFGQLYFWNFY